MRNMKLIILIVIAILMNGCAETSVAETPILPSLTSSSLSSVTLLPTNTPIPPTVTQTPYPTETVTPAKPTRTPRPTGTATSTLPPRPTKIKTQISTIAPLKVQSNLLDAKTLANGPIYSLAWSPDGSVIAAAGFGHVSLWNVQNGQKRGDLEGISGYVWGVVWSPDGKWIATVSDDGFVRLWDAASGLMTRENKIIGAFCVTWSPDSTHLAAGTETGKIYIWDITNGTEPYQWAAAGFIVALDWSPDGQMLATGELSGKIEIWDVNSGENLKWFDGYTRERSDVNGVDWSPDGKLLATAHQDGILRVWDFEAGLLAMTLTKHTNWVRGVAWSPDGSMIASTGNDKSLRLWDAATGQLLVEVRDHGQPVWSVAWSPDGMHLATGEGKYEGKDNRSSLIIWKFPQ